MKQKMKTSRRNFLSKTALGVGGAGFLHGSVNAGGLDPASAPAEKNKRLPREVWVATLTQYDLRGNTVKELIANTVKVMESVASYTPDVVCLPEAFHVSGLPKSLPVSAETAEEPIGHLTQPLADFAKKFRCYVIAPVYALEKGHHYNTAVVIEPEWQARRSISQDTPHRR